ncbi:MAG TPA: Rieske 2Fe-2S domain-containing protein [Rhodocyclaceae bacterium]|nr:Rieske 2Fe-2S domain-containing protein [Rhodocyclaceae bacterium]
MAEEQRLICLSADLPESGKGVRFTAECFGRQAPAFVIRYDGKVYGYLNECGHVPAELDWQPGEFFDYSKLYLICSIHGALYAPESGKCLGGRCQGKGLKPLHVEERDGAIYLHTNNQNE